MQTILGELIGYDIFWLRLSYNAFCFCFCFLRPRKWLNSENANQPDTLPFDLPFVTHIWHWHDYPYFFLFREVENENRSREKARFSELNWLLLYKMKSRVERGILRKWWSRHGGKYRHATFALNHHIAFEKKNQSENNKLSVYEIEQEMKLKRTSSPANQ